MATISDCINEYTAQLGKRQIQRAYKAIMGFMSSLASYLEKAHPGFTTSSLYFGYMDMTYFAFTPADLNGRKLKVAIVYLHEISRFDAWLVGVNRKVQAEYLGLLSGRDTGSYRLSQAGPGVDSIIETVLLEKPDFDHPETLMQQIETRTFQFIDDIRPFLL